MSQPAPHPHHPREPLSAPILRLIVIYLALFTAGTLIAGLLGASVTVLFALIIAGSAGFAGIVIVRVVVLAAAEDDALSEPQCPDCLYDLRNLPLDPQRRVTCPECGRTWRLSETAQPANDE